MSSCVSLTFYLGLPKFLSLPLVPTVNLTNSMQHYQIGQIARVVVGQTLHLHCNASADLNSIYKWQVLPEGRDVATTDNIVADDDTLTIVYVQRQHENRYQCTVGNKLGSITRSSQIKVYGR